MSIFVYEQNRIHCRVYATRRQQKHFFKTANEKNKSSTKSPKQQVAAAFNTIQIAIHTIQAIHTIKPIKFISTLNNGIANT